MIVSIKNFFMYIFKNIFYMGILLLFLAILLQLHNNNYYCLNILQKLLETVGIALIIAYFFTYVSSTNEFTNYISKILQEIIISKKFLANISDSNKIEVMSSLLKPSDSTIKKYSDIERYYDYFIKNVFSVTTKNIRNNYKIHGTISFSETINKVVCNAHYSYRLYPSKDGYLPIKMGFSIEDDNSYVNELKIYSLESNQPFELTKSQIDDKFTKKDNMKVYEHDMKNYHDEHLDILFSTLEAGESHWLVYKFKVLQPTNGFYLNLRCEHNVIIKDHIIYDFANNYDINILEDKSEISINCNQWINEGAGVTILFGLSN